MKNLIVINGTMGVGKTTTCNELNKRLPNSVFLDGDWCWNMNPFVVTDETKKMVIDNITYLLKSYLNCSQFENIVFCWVIHQESIMEELISRLENEEFKLYFLTLVCSEEKLRTRLTLDIEKGERERNITERSVSRLKHYDSMSSQKIDVSDIDVHQVTEQVLRLIGIGNE